MSDKTSLREEFQSAEALHRFEASMMLGQTAGYLVALGALLTAAGDISHHHPSFKQIGVALFGILVSIVFLVITHRCGQNLRGARRRALELAEKLDYRLYSPEYRAPLSKVFVGANCSKAVCIAGGVFWVVTLIRVMR